MFNGMMDPELMRLAQEQMSRIPPQELMKMQQQIMSNPELLKMASESMKNMNPSDIKLAAEQMKHVRNEDMAEITERMSDSSPAEIASMKARADVQSTYLVQAAQSLKEQGNQLHSLGKYSEAVEKYLLAKSNVSGMPTPEAKKLLLASSLNLMSCYLKTGQFEDCIKQGSEVLEYDAVNVKALYRRGQAYRQIGNLEMAIDDLRRAAEASPDDEAIAQVLSDANVEARNKRTRNDNQGPLIEEITEEEATELTSKAETSIRERDLHSENVMMNRNELRSEENNGTMSEPASILNQEKYAGSLKALEENPDMIRSMQTMMTSMSPESIAALGGGSLSPDMVKTMTDMFKNMPPEEIQNLIKMSSALGGQSSSPLLPTGTSAQSSSNVTSSSNSFSAIQGDQILPSQMQDQIQMQMKDPAMKKMMTDMVKNMSPEMMSSMSEKFGVKLSHEDAVKAQSALSSMAPDDIDRLMVWFERIQKAIHRAKACKNWMLGRSGLIFAIILLLLAILLRWLGFLGN